MARNPIIMLSKRLDKIDFYRYSTMTYLFTMRDEGVISLSHVETKEAVSRRRAGWSFVPPCGAAMETDPTKLGTMKLMGTFGVPSYTSFGDEYMKKIGAAHRFRPSCSAPAG